MFDFHFPFTADALETEAVNPLIDLSLPVDSSVDPMLFETVPVNLIDLP